MTLNSSDIKVAIVDDSALIRQIIQKVVDKTPGMRVVGMAQDPFEAREMIKAQNPDVITLDVEMPKMNGIEFLDKIMKLRPMPVIMVSTLTEKGADITVQALEIGAIDYVAKPEIKHMNDDFLSFFEAELIPKIQNIKSTNISALSSLKNNTSHSANTSQKSAYDLIAIASSTGGIERLRYLFSHIEIELPPVVIVQHINEIYVQNMVERMQNICPPHLKVQKSRHNKKLEANTIYFADNVSHMEIKPKGNDLYLFHHDEPPLNGFKASADYLFQSISFIKNLNILGLILSGMGNDGAKGLKQLKNSGALTIGENKNSCLVYGMSKAAMDMGAIDKELTIQSITKHLNSERL